VQSTFAKVEAFKEPYIYEKPKGLEFITDIPKTLEDGFKLSFNTRRETLLGWSVIIGTTGILYIYDEKFYKHAREMARKFGLSNDDHTKPMLTWGGTNIFRGPTDTGSFIHFIGDGWLQFGVAATFVGIGHGVNDNRMMRTGSQVMTSLLSASIPAQIIKRATGREDPNRSTAYRGKWRPFAKDYDKDVSKYDAVPSGHLLATTSTLTVIYENYPEYSDTIIPVGLGLMTLLSFQLTNIGVHWASDFPLAIGIGHVFGKAAASHGKTKIVNPLGGPTPEFSLLPTFEMEKINPEHFNRKYGVMAQFNF
jgi:hypothetical protein